MTQPKAAKKTPPPPKGLRTLYTLEVLLTDGPFTESFVDENPTVSRTIQISGDNTLEDLHDVIFAAFDRDEEHLYEFQVGGKMPHDRKARRYGDAMADEGPFDNPDSAGIAGATRMDALHLKPRAVFFYWFDFGDDWWHRIKVTAIENAAPEGPLPRVIERVGKSPPQYPDYDEDEDGDFDDDDEDLDEEEDDEGEDLDDKEKTKA